MGLVIALIVPEHMKNNKATQQVLNSKLIYRYRQQETKDSEIISVLYTNPSDPACTPFLLLTELSSLLDLINLAVLLHQEVDLLEVAVEYKHAFN